MLDLRKFKNITLERISVVLERLRFLDRKQKFIGTVILVIFCLSASFVFGQKPQAIVMDYQAPVENWDNYVVQEDTSVQSDINFGSKLDSLKSQVSLISKALGGIVAPDIVKSKTIRVPEDFAKIQGAIDSAKSGDVIMVAAGEYKENIIMKDGVSLIGAGADGTIIDGQKSGNVVAFKNVANKETRLENFTIKNSGENLSGVFIEDSSPIVSRNVILDNDYNIYIKGNSSPTVQKNKLTSSKAGVQIFNLEYVAGYKPIITDNIVFKNKKGINVYNGEALIEHNTISLNSYYKDDMGATFGVYLASAGSDIKNNIITDNGTCELCSGIYADEKSKSVVIAYNNLWNNKNNFVCFGECSMESSNLSNDPEFLSEENLSLSEDSEFLNSASDGQKLGSRL
jgi:parallel beta-helix repeat protein